MKIVFVCTGNTCRSPLAEGLFRKIVEENNCCMDVSSAGISVGFGSAVSGNSVVAAMELGADISSHIPKQLTEKEVFDADYVFCMTDMHKRCIVNALPGYAGKIWTVADFAGKGDVPDPYGGDLDEYRLVARQLLDAVEIIFKKIVDDNGNQI